MKGDDHDEETRMMLTSKPRYEIEEMLDAKTMQPLEGARLAAQRYDWANKNLEPLAVDLEARIATLAGLAARIDDSLTDEEAMALDWVDSELRQQLGDLRQLIAESGRRAREAGE